MLTQEMEKAEMLSPSPGTTRPPRALPDALSQCMCGTHTHRYTYTRILSCISAYCHPFITPTASLTLKKDVGN